MKRLLIVLLLLFPLLTLSACEPQVYSGKIILEGKHALMTVDGDLVMLGGQVTLKQGSQVTGSVYLLSGDLQADGTIRGDVSLMAGTLTLGPHARVEGNLKVGAGTLNRSPGAMVVGGVVNGGAGIAVPLAPAWWNAQSLLAQVFWFPGRALLVALLALLLVRFVPKPTARLGKAVAEHTVIAGALGLLALVVTLSLLVFMAFTIILIPLALLGILMLGVAALYGWIAIGLQVGQALVWLFKWKVRSSVAAFLGTLLFMLAVLGIGYIPIAGSVALVLSAAIGLGGVLLTRMGTRTYALGKASIAIGGDEQQVFTPTDPVTR
jgi:cytoskeletal protein CcmA (bactofilin family)